MSFSVRGMMTGAVSTAVLLALFAISVPAQKKSRTQDAARHASEAAKTFTEIMNVRDKAIPKELLDKAEAIAVFPGVLKAAFIVGGRGGQGVISKRVRRGLADAGRAAQGQDKCARGRPRPAQPVEPGASDGGDRPRPDDRPSAAYG